MTNEQGKREIPFALVIRLANFYNVSINDIAGIDKRPTPLYPNRPCPWRGGKCMECGMRIFTTECPRDFHFRAP